GLLGGGPLQKLLGGLLLLVVVVPVVAGLLLAGWGIGRAALGWTVRHGYGRQPALLAGVLAGLALALAWLVDQIAPPLALALAPLLWALALGALLAVRPDYRGAAIAPTLNALLLTTALAGLAALARTLLPQTPAWVVADGPAFVFLLVAGFAALLDVDLHLAPAIEL